MTITIHKGNGADVEADSYGGYILELVNEWPRLYPGHKLFLLDSDEKHSYETTIVTEKIKVPAGVFWRKKWFDKKLPAILQKQQADLFLSLDGYLPAVLPIPAVIIWPAASTNQVAHGFFSKRYFPRFLRDAKTVIAGSAAVAEELNQFRPATKSRVDVFGQRPLGKMKNVTEAEKDNVREKHTGGVPYFLCARPLNADEGIIDVLKAFSIFKKRQKSNWKMVLSGDIQRATPGFREQLGAYRYRDEVITVDANDEKEQLVLHAAAYAVIDPAVLRLATNSHEAIAAGVPVLAGKHRETLDQYGDAAWYHEHGDHNELGSQMMTLYKDESAHAALIRNMQIRTAGFDATAAAQRLWSLVTASSTGAENATNNASI